MRRLMEFIYFLVLLAVLGLFFALGLAFFLYVFLFAIVFGVVAVIVRRIQRWIGRKKQVTPPKPSSKGRVIDSDEWKNL